jgi:uncharacterized repeat protein (TIGR02543 family)
MKKRWWALLAVACAVFVGCGGKNSASESEDTPDIPETYTISYQYFDEALQTLLDIPSGMWKADGEYPTEFDELTVLEIDGLRDVRKNDDTTYAFTGWYYDAEYENPVLENQVQITALNDITLYAKIVERAKQDGDTVVATISYVWDDYGDIKTGIEYFPEKMTEGLDIPTEYVEGEAVALPKLNMWKKNSRLVYEFEGWYYDENLKNKVTGDTLPATTTGNVTLYAKIVAYIN